MTKTIAVLIILISLRPLIISQTEIVQFEHLSVEKGLSQNTVWSVFRDDRGFLWLGTADGLNRYDGYKFKVFRNDPNDPTSISANRVYSICQDKSGTLWVGTYGGGLNKYEPETESFVHYRYNPHDSCSLSDDEVLIIYEDRSNILWIGTEGGGLNKFDAQTKKFKRYRSDPNNTFSISDDEVQSVFEDHLGILWIGTKRGGLNNFNTETEKFICYKNKISDPQSISNDEILSICEDRFGNLWIGTGNGGLNKFNRATGTFTRFLYDFNDPYSVSANRIFSILEDDSDNLWIGTMGGGLNKLLRDRNQFIYYLPDELNPSSINSSGIFSLFQDKTGILWIGTYGGGVNKLDNTKGRFKLYRHNPNDKNSISNSVIFSICEDKSGDIWIGTGDGLNRINRNKGIISVYKNNPANPNSLSDDEVISIYEDKEGVLWIGTYGGGLNRFDRERNQFVHFKKIPNNPYSISNNEIFSIYEDNSGSLWIGTFGGGLNLFDRKTNRFIHYRHNPDDQFTISTDKIFSIFEDSYGNLWIGTDSGGLNRFDRRENKFIRYTHNPNDPNSLSNDAIFSIYESRSGDLWIGTHGGGLNKFIRSEEIFEHIRLKDGLPNDVVYGVLEDDFGNLWLSTNKGLSKFNPRTKSFRNFDASDGLQGNEFNQGAYCKSKTGEFIFGGPNGFNIFHPDSIKNNHHRPEIIITDFQLLHKRVSIGYDSTWGRSILKKSITETEQIELNHDDNVISFEFTALDFRNPEKNRYAYILEGFDKEWNYTDATRRFVTYTNLNPGEYIFKVKGTNNDGIWSEKGISLKLIIKPPWFATIWAYISYAVIIILIVFLIRQYDLKRQRLKHELELEHDHAEKLEEIDRMKSRFFANISHEFRTPLTLILGPAEKIIPGCSDEFLEKQTGLIRRNAKRLLALINQLLELSKLEAGKLKLQASPLNLSSFVKGIAMTFESIAETKDITLKIKLEKANVEVYFDKDKMQKILTNILSNAFKFTMEGGKITISLSETENDTVILSVRDTGIGISKKELPKLFERFYQVDGSHTREHEGTGIGLALTKELVELHRGRITIESQEGEWTEVVIELPLGKSHLKKDEIDEFSEPEEEPLEIFEDDYISELDNKSSIIETETEKDLVLIVEDNSDVRDYIKDAIGNDYHTIEAVNGEQGLRKAEKIIPDLILSDIMMPKMDGIEFLNRIKNDSKTSHIPVILLTAKSEQADKLEGLSIGADAYLTKPFDIEELKVRIKSLIDQRRRLQIKFSKGDYVPEREEKKLNKLDEQFINRLMGIIDEHIDEEEFSIDQFGKEAGMSRSQIHRKLKALTGRSPSQYLRLVRLSKAKTMIEEQRGTVSEIAYSVGFSSPAYFSRCFKTEFGYPPSDLVN